MKNKETPKFLPKGTPLVVKGEVPRLCYCKVVVESYDVDDDTYATIIAEDYLSLDELQYKKGEKWFFDRSSLFASNNIPKEWPKHLMEFLKSDAVTSAATYSQLDMVKDGLALLKAELIASKKSEDKTKLKQLISEMRAILLKF